MRGHWLIVQIWLVDAWIDPSWVSLRGVWTLNFWNLSTTVTFEFLLWHIKDILEYAFLERLWVASIFGIKFHQKCWFFEKTTKNHIFASKFLWQANKVNFELKNRFLELNILYMIKVAIQIFHDYTFWVIWFEKLRQIEKWEIIYLVKIVTFSIFNVVFVTNAFVSELSTQVCFTNTYLYTTSNAIYITIF